MKRILLGAFVAVLIASPGHATVFGSASGARLQSVFNRLGYSSIDVADYQTDLTFQLAGMARFELLSRDLPRLSFGVLETHQGGRGLRFRHHRIFGRRASVGSTAWFDMGRPGSEYSFFVQRTGRRWWRRRNFYSYSPFNRHGAVQTLFYADPNQAGTYLLAWQGLYVGDPHSDNSYDDLVVRMSVHPAPEPATWILLAAALGGAGLVTVVRRRRTA